MKKLIKCLVSAVFLLVLTSCVTLAPKPVEDRAAAPDRSTPSQYHSKYNNGILGYIIPGKVVYVEDMKPGEKLNAEILYVIITPDKRDEYNRLIDAYQLQLKENENVVVKTDSGIAPYKDRYGNNVYTLDSVGAVVFVILKSYERQKLDHDSIWLKMKNSVKM